MMQEYLEITRRRKVAQSAHKRELMPSLAGGGDAP